MKHLIVIACVVGACVLAYLAVQSYGRYSQQKEQTVQALAVVKGVETRDIRSNRNHIKRFFHPIFHFETQDGESHFVVLEQGTQLRYKYNKYDEAMLIFPQGNPQKARLLKWTDGWLLPGAYAMASVLTMVLAFVFVRQLRNTAQKDAAT